MRLKVGKSYKHLGDVVTLVKIFPFNARQPNAYRVAYANGHVVDCRASELEEIPFVGWDRLDPRYHYPVIG